MALLSFRTTKKECSPAEPDQERKGAALQRLACGHRNSHGVFDSAMLRF
jgi:hypothetical protein